MLDGFFQSKEFLALTSGYRPISRTGRFDDVHLIQDRTRVSWNKAGLISQSEMMHLNKRAVDAVFNVLLDSLRLGLDDRQIGCLSLLAKCLACHCFRNTPIEEIHGGRFPFDMEGTPIIVRDTERDAPWEGVARIAENEEGDLKRLAFRRLSEILPRIDDDRAVSAFIRQEKGYVVRWDQPTALVEIDLHTSAP